VREGSDPPPIILGPGPDNVRLQRHVDLSRPGVDRTQFFFSYSGGLLVDGDLGVIGAELSGYQIEIAPPCRIGSPSFRPNPQFTFDNFLRFFQVELPPSYPLQAATFPGVSTPSGATASCWFGPSAVVPAGGPDLPPDTFVVTRWGPNSPNEGENIERYILAPLLEWLRVLTHQWWIGRSIEGVSGPLHFIAPINAKGEVVGSPSPVARFTSAGPHMVPLTQDIWRRGAELALGGATPSASRKLEADANFMLASREFRSGVILASSSIESTRDEALEAGGVKFAKMGTSSTDLLKHLSVGFGRVFLRDLAQEDPALFEILSAFWRARGEAAHGKSVRWRTRQSDVPIEEVEFGTLSDGLSSIRSWIEDVGTSSQMSNVSV
jgi:hypothetical protein